MSAPKPPLSAAQVAELRAARADGATLRDLGKQYDRSHETVRRILMQTGGDNRSAHKSIVSRTFGQLTVVGEAPPGASGSRRALCRCTCGNELVTWLCMLTQGRTADCGCQDVGRGRMLTHAGRTQSLMRWAEELRVNHRTLRLRLDRWGWSLEEALTTPAHGAYHGDRRRHGCGKRGSQNPRSVINEWRACGLVALVLMGRTIKDSACALGIETKAAYTVWQQLTWRHVFEPLEECA